MYPFNSVDLHFMQYCNTALLSPCLSLCAPHFSSYENEAVAAFYFIPFHFYSFLLLLLHQFRKIKLNFLFWFNFFCKRNLRNFFISVFFLIRCLFLCFSLISLFKILLRYREDSVDGNALGSIWICNLWSGF